MLEQAGWGVMQLPAADYPDEVAAPLLAQVAEQAEEFARHGYRWRWWAAAPGWSRRSNAAGVAAPPAIEPAAADELRDFLAEVAAG